VRSVSPAVACIASAAVTDQYEHRQMMEIRNKLVNWRRRLRADQLATGRSWWHYIGYTAETEWDRAERSVRVTRTRRCHYCVSCPTATRRRVMFVYPSSVRLSVIRSAISWTSRSSHQVSCPQWRRTGVSYIFLLLDRAIVLPPSLNCSLTENFSFKTTKFGAENSHFRGLLRQNFTLEHPVSTNFLNPGRRCVSRGQ